MKYSFQNMAIACNNFDETTMQYDIIDFKKPNIVWDKSQHIHICSLKANGLPDIELISSSRDNNSIKEPLKHLWAIHYQPFFEAESTLYTLIEFGMRCLIFINHPAEVVAIEKIKQHSHLQKFWIS
jgi:hypothetical protein